MVPDMPFPNNRPACRTCLFDLDDLIRRKGISRDGIWVPSRSDRLITCSCFPHDHQHVSIGETFNVMMAGTTADGISVVPCECSVP